MMENNKNSLIKNKNFAVIHGWMINELKLNGNELLTYSLIYGSTQTNEQWFTGSINYIAQWCNTSKRTIYTVLKFLVNKNLVIKKDVEINNVKFCHYKANLNIIDENDTKKSTFSPRMDFKGGGENFSPYNIDNNKNNISPKKNLDDFNDNEVKETSLSFPINSSSSSMEMCDSVSSSKSLGSKKDSLFSSFENQNVVSALMEWYEYKKERNEVLSKSSLKKAYETLLELSGANSDRARDIIDYNINGNYSKLFPIKEIKIKKSKEESSKQKKEENNSKEVIENKPDVAVEEDDETGAIKERLRRFYDNSNPRYSELQFYFENLKIKKFNSKEIVLDFGNYGNPRIDLEFWRDHKYPLEDGTVKTVEGMKSKIENMLILYKEDGTSSKIEAKLYNKDYEEQFKQLEKDSLQHSDGIYCGEKQIRG